MMNDEPFALVVKFTEQDGSIETVEMSFCSENEAAWHVPHMFENRFFRIDPTPALQSDGIRGIYIPTARIISVQLVERQE